MTKRGHILKEVSYLHHLLWISLSRLLYSQQTFSWIFLISLYLPLSVTRFLTVSLTHCLSSFVSLSTSASPPLSLFWSPSISFYLCLYLSLSPPPFFFSSFGLLLSLFLSLFLSLPLSLPLSPSLPLPLFLLPGGSSSLSERTPHAPCFVLSSISILAALLLANADIASTTKVSSKLQNRRIACSICWTCRKWMTNKKRGEIVRIGERYGGKERDGERKREKILVPAYWCFHVVVLRERGPGFLPGTHHVLWWRHQDNMPLGWHLVVSAMQIPLPEHNIHDSMYNTMIAMLLTR